MLQFASPDSLRGEVAVRPCIGLALVQRDEVSLRAADVEAQFVPDLPPPFHRAVSIHGGDELPVEIAHLLVHRSAFEWMCERGWDSRQETSSCRGTCSRTAVSEPRGC